MALLDRIRQYAEKLAREAMPADPASFNDPLALRTEWTPAAGGGASFRTHRLVETGPGRLQFRATLGMTLFALVFIAAGGFAAFVATHAVAGQPDAAWWERLLPLAFGGVFAMVGGVMLAFSRRTIMFDRGSGWFWKGWREPVAPGPDAGKRACRLTEVHALQLLKEHVRGNKSSYWSYELNLVLRDGRRINVVDHGNVERLREDASRVASFLGCRIWDATRPAVGAASPAAPPMGSATPA